MQLSCQVSHGSNVRVLSTAILPRSRYPMRENHVVRLNLYTVVCKIIAASDGINVNITLANFKSIILSLRAMSNSLEAPSCALPPHLVAWRSLVSRSVAAWDGLATTHQPISRNILLPRYILKECHSLDDFFNKNSNTLMFWFFQQRSAFMLQKRMKKWSCDELNDYILLPASPGFVSRRDCFFLSHFWQSQDDPDLDGEYLRLHQAKLKIGRAHV